MTVSIPRVRAKWSAAFAGLLTLVLLGAVATPSTGAPAARGPIDSSGSAESALLTIGRAVWVKTSPPGEGGAVTRSLWSRTVVIRNGAIVLGHAIELDPDVAGDYAAAGTIVADVEPDPLDSDYENLTITTPLSSIVHRFRQDGSDPLGEISGNRALWGGGGNVVDLTSGRLLHLANQPRGSALWGDDYFYFKRDGSLWLDRLGTGRRVELRAPRTLLGHATISAWAGHVIFSGVGRDRTALHVIDLRRPRVSYRVSTGGQPYAEATSNGILISDQPLHSTPSAPKYWLRPYGRNGAVRRLLPTAAFGGHSAAQVSANVASWIDSAGVLQAKSLPIVPDRPWSLGAAAHRRSSTSGWQLLAPFSAPLTACRVTLSRHKKVLASLPCSKTDAVEGSAFVRWDGENAAGHHVPAGVVTWRVRAANGLGSVLTSAGKPGKVAGHFRID